MHYGYIGQGNLGANCACCLLREGMQVTVTDINKDACQKALDAGAKWADSPAELAAQVDHVITCLPSPAVSEIVADQMLPAMKEGAHWIEMSTLGRDEVMAFADKAAAHGVRLMELPVTGGVHLAAHIEQTRILSSDQIAKYQRLRGYAAAEIDSGRAHRHRHKHQH